MERTFKITEFGELDDIGGTIIRMSTNAIMLGINIGVGKTIKVSNKKPENITYRLVRCRRMRTVSYYYCLRTMTLISICRRELRKYFPYRTKNLYVTVVN